MRPEKILAQYSKKYPNAWKNLENFYLYQGRDGLPGWPKYIFVPMAGAYAVVSGGDSTIQVSGKEVAAIAAMGAWRLTQSIYRYHPALFEEISSTRITGNLPIEVLHRLPEWCVYIETPGWGFQGFWAHLEWDANTEEEELRLLFLLDNGEVFPVPIHLVGTLEEGLQRTLEVTRAVIAQKTGKKPEMSGKVVLPKNTKKPGEYTDPIEEVVHRLESSVSLVLYLCSADPEYVGGRSRPAPKKTRKGLRLFPVPGTKVIEVGKDIGERLRRGKSTERESRPTDRRSPRPHVRRGHWHHYWTGPLKGERKLILKWIHPLVVGIE